VTIENENAKIDTPAVRGGTSGAGTGTEALQDVMRDETMTRGQSDATETYSTTAAVVEAEGTEMDTVEVGEVLRGVAEEALEEVVIGRRVPRLRPSQRSLHRT
jgi:hypothetical protein